MEVLISNRTKNLASIIQEKAKYQKVLLLYDNSISLVDINEIYNKIRELCIFNKMDLNNIDEKEFYNGYRLLIFCCNCASLSKFSLNKEEFINIYYPTNNQTLHFFANNLNLFTKDCYLLLSSTQLDLTLLSSLYFNNFFNYTNNLLNFQPAQLKFEENLNIFSLVNNLNKIEKPYYFTDLEILNNINIQYNEIMLLHLILVNAFLTFITEIKNNIPSIIDVYKLAKQNFNLIDKCYTTFFNETIYNSVILNYNSLHDACIKTKSKILSLISLNNTPTINLDKIITKTKEYLKTSNSKLNFLYFFNVFGY